MEFDKQFAEEYINSLLKKYRIKVCSWSRTSCGYAEWKSKRIKIPKPTDVDRFGVCLHEIKHILDGNKGKRFEQEFYCDLYALNIIKEFEYDHVQWEERMRWHSLSRIAMASNRGLSLDKIKPEIKEFFKEIDFSLWSNNNVFVHSNRENKLGYAIEYIIKLPKEEIIMLLNRKGMWLERSQRDDSTYGKWIVKSNGNAYGTEFDNLPSIVSHYELA